MQCSQRGCCVYQSAAALPFSCNSVWSAPPPSKVGQFSFEYWPLSYKIISGIHHLPHFRRLAYCPTPALNLCASPNICWVLAAPLGFGLSSYPCSTSTSDVGVRLYFAVYVFQFCWRVVHSVQGMPWITFPGGG
jgi:hypothetical protein